LSKTENRIGIETIQTLVQNFDITINNDFKVAMVKQTQ